jgi:hypothetical protein
MTMSFERSSGNFFGKNILKANKEQPSALVGKQIKKEGSSGSFSHKKWKNFKIVVIEYLRKRDYWLNHQSIMMKMVFRDKNILNLFLEKERMAVKKEIKKLLKRNSTCIIKKKMKKIIIGHFKWKMRN